MKTIRKLLCILLSIATLLCCCVVASAAEPRAVYMGVLTIFASSDGVGSSAFTEDHAFISFKNTSSQQLNIGGLNVNPGHEITIGAWCTKPAGHTIGADDKWPWGVFINVESHLIHNDAGLSDRVSLTINVTLEDIMKLREKVSNPGVYDIRYNNCATFAKNAWNSVAPNDLQLSAGYIDQPVTLYNNIKKKSGYQSKRPVMNITPVGYVNGKGSFVSITLRCGGGGGGDHRSLGYGYTSSTSEVI